MARLLAFCEARACPQHAQTSSRTARHPSVPRVWRKRSYVPALDYLQHVSAGAATRHATLSTRQAPPSQLCECFRTVHLLQCVIHCLLLANGPPPGPVLHRGAIFSKGFCCPECPELLVQLLASGALGSTLGLRLANRGLLDFKGRQFLIEFLQPPPPPLFPFFQVATLRRIIRLS